jgi:hypothetical protein
MSGDEIESGHPVVQNYSSSVHDNAMSHCLFFCPIRLLAPLLVELLNKSYLDESLQSPKAPRRHPRHELSSSREQAFEIDKRPIDDLTYNARINFP